MNIYVGNLSFDVTEDDLRQEFQSFGAVTSVNVIKDNTAEDREDSLLLRCRHYPRARQQLPTSMEKCWRTVNYGSVVLPNDQTEEVEVEDPIMTGEAVDSVEDQEAIEGEGRNLTVTARPGTLRVMN